MNIGNILAMGGVRCFGHKLPLESRDGWFYIEDIEKFKHNVKFNLSMHGGIIYFAKDELTDKILESAKEIAANYSECKFKYFKNPADEPVLALSMAINDCPPVEWDIMDNKAYLFYPVALNCQCNILKGKLSYTKDGITWISDVFLMHWQNANTKQPLYLKEIYRLDNQKDVSRLQYLCLKVRCFFEMQHARIKRKLRNYL